MLAAYTAIDANINRALEGIRVCEDVLRFVYHLPGAGQCKELRHEITQYRKGIEKMILLNARNIGLDKQKFIDLKSEMHRESIDDIFSANIHRAMEAVRVLEELDKLVPARSEVSLQRVRFQMYQLEKETVPLLLKDSLLSRFSGSLYAIVDSSFVEKNGYIAVTEKLIRGGAAIIQLRMKHEKHAVILETAKSLSALCKKNDVVFIINDHPDIAILAQADGVHVGEGDLPVREVRSFLPPHMLIGVSTHSFEQAVSAFAESPDYLAIGPLFTTKSKSGDLLSGIGLDMVNRITEKVSVPVVGIGGISMDNIVEVKKSGLDCVAVISALYQDNRIVENCKKLLNIIDPVT